MVLHPSFMGHRILSLYPSNEQNESLISVSMSSSSSTTIQWTSSLLLLLSPHVINELLHEFSVISEMIEMVQRNEKEVVSTISKLRSVIDDDQDPLVASVAKKDGSIQSSSPIEFHLNSDAIHIFIYNTCESHAKEVLYKDENEYNQQLESIHEYYHSMTNTQIHSLFNHKTLLYLVIQHNLFDLSLSSELSLHDHCQAMDLYTYRMPDFYKSTNHYNSNQYLFISFAGLPKDQQKDCFSITFHKDVIENKTVSIEIQEPTIYLNMEWILYCIQSIYQVLLSYEDYSSRSRCY